MPIVRTYACPECNHMIEVTLAAEDWDAEPPNCPRCIAWDFEEPMRQEFKAPAIVGSPRARATALAEDIAAKDYHVADMQRDKHAPTPKVRYQDQNPSNWGKAPDGSVITPAAIQQAMALGRQTRLNFGDGLDVLQSNLKNGAEPDLIEISKRRSTKIW